MEHHDVVIIGGGPAGLTLACELRERGRKDVVVLEREAQAGGIPRHCGHGGFGLYNSWRTHKGPTFAKLLREPAREIDLRTATTVLNFTMSGNLRLHSAKGIQEMSAGTLVLATGTREASRAARLIGGNKLPGVMNTGELQQRVYLNHEKPFSRPVIIGSEWVSFSSLLTCRHAGMRVQAMITEEASLDAPGIFGLGARLVFGAPVLRKAKLRAILGHKKVEAVEVEQGGTTKQIACDGVIISGKFRSESALYADGFIEREGWAPKVTEQFKTSRPNVLAVGNVLGHLERAGTCMLQARELAKVMTA
ncbi:NAD(P)/FAD-dependent oxidoreductase [Aestuariivirga litoralis]|uniref:NAD(P)/FAD-dependent oxidoreductase n=1 Tax=Aestuariivirga litoralis TaxID=2650924 RepID=UPI001FEED826|nr:FAD-dependent oxidoreductase [Aestuariivirga litoralis]